LRNHWRYFDAALALVVIIGSLFYVYDLLVGSRGLDVAYIARNYTLYLHAVFTNVYATTIAFLVGMALGFSVGWLRTARTVSLAKFAASMRIEKRERQEDPAQSEAARRLMVVLSLLWYGAKYVVRRIGDGLVEIIRGTPLYVQILFASSFFIVFLPQYATEGILIGIVALAINTGGYQAEIFRAGLQTVHSGQIEAARAIGFSRLKAMRYVVLPQALRLIIPPLTNEYIGLFKASTFLFVLGVRTEISYIAQHEGFAGDVFEIFAMVTAIFLAITVTLSFVVQALERRFRIPGLGIQQVKLPRGVRTMRVDG
jgi:polar amino acid transport system permease protein